MAKTAISKIGNKYVADNIATGIYVVVPSSSDVSPSGESFRGQLSGNAEKTVRGKRYVSRFLNQFFVSRWCSVFILISY